MSDVLSFLFGLSALLLIVILAVMAGLLKKPAHENESRKDQEAEDQGVVDSMRGELDYLRKDGLL